MSSPYGQLRIDQSASIPIASQLANQLIWLVASGQIGSDEQLPPLRDLAGQLGINLHTVRAAYRQLEENGMATVRQGRGTTVLEFDRKRLARNRLDVPSFTVGVLIPSYSPFYSPFLDSLESSAEEDPLMFLVCNTHDSRARVGRWLDQLLSRNVDGILIASQGLPDDLSPQGDWEGESMFPPLVFIDIPDAPEPRLLFDHDRGGELIARHMLEHRFERPAVITPPLEWSNVEETFRGFERTWTEAGHDLDKAQVVQVDDFTSESGWLATRRLLASQDPPDAIFTAGDLLAVGAQQALSERGMQAPRDLGLLGYGDMELSGLVQPPLTTVKLDTAEMGRLAMRMLRTRMAGDAARSEVRIPVNLTVRRSCGCPG